MKKLLYIVILFFSFYVAEFAIVTVVGLIDDSLLNSYFGVCFMNSLNALLMYFIFPWVSIKYIQKENPFSSVKINKGLKSRTLCYIIGICFFMFFAINMFQMINEQFPIPSFLDDVIITLDMLQQQSQAVYDSLLNVNAVWKLLIAIVVAAIIPAVCEEFFFRGWLQTQASRFVNHHVAIWVLAILFATLHLQYKLFIPQLLMGALFGYVFYYSRSLWSAIIIHFINNCATIIVAYLTYNELVNFDVDDIGILSAYILGIIATIIIILFLLLVKRNNYSINPSDSYIESI